MTDQLKTTDVNAIHTKPFAKMTPREKATHLGKVFLFLLTFGFAFPHVLSD